LTGLGAALTYATIFSYVELSLLEVFTFSVAQNESSTYIRAVRGNLGYMAWSFDLFIASLILATTCKLLLMFSARVPRKLHFHPARWERLMGVGVFTATGMGFAAIILLVLSVGKLGYSGQSLSLGTSSNSSNQTNGHDGSLVLSVGPWPPTILSFTVSDDTAKSLNTQHQH
jgi:hypothetical protein